MRFNLKKLYKSLLVFMMVFSCFTITDVYAESTNKNAFADTTEIEEMIERARASTVVLDKGQTSRSVVGTYPTRKGVILVTTDKYKGIVPLGHAAIIYSSGTVVEALSQGVVQGLNDWNTSKNETYGLSVLSTTATQDAAAADYCYGKIGKPYNSDFYNVNTRVTFYCSQLVWAAYKDLYSVDLNTSSYGTAIHPLELRDTSLTATIYKKTP